MEFYTKDKPHGAFHKIRSSFDEIFGKPETGSPGNKRAHEETVGSDFKKTDSDENK
ncbi:MAG TPA: hypothetical protein HPP97_03740 [Desulfuromonadales bacterium]|nr:hypothetical protein [Desulfuromonadales bacterium]